MTRPTMRFVPVKSAGQQAAMLDHKARDFLVRQRTQTVNAIRAHLGEFGLVVAKGAHNLDWLLEAARNVPEAARPALDPLAGQLRDLEARIEAATARITAAQKADPLARRLATIPGLGPIASSAFAATRVAARQEARRRTLRPSGPRETTRLGWACGPSLGRIAFRPAPPRVHSSGGIERLGRISKAGNVSGASAAPPGPRSPSTLRRLLYLGAMARSEPSVAMRPRSMANARRARRGVPADQQAPDWLDRMLARKPVKVVAVALAARMARTV